MHSFYDGGSGGVVVVGGFPVLEVNVGVLGGTLLDGVLGVESPAPEILDILHVDQLLHFFVIENFDLGDFVAGAEAVEEVQEGNLGLKSGKVRDQSEVVRFPCTELEAIMAKPV